MLKSIRTERTTTVPGCVWRVTASELSECDIRLSQSPAAGQLPCDPEYLFSLFCCFYLIVLSAWVAQREDSCVL